MVFSLFQCLAIFLVQCFSDIIRGVFEITIFSATQYNNIVADVASIVSNIVLTLQRCVVIANRPMYLQNEVERMSG